MPHRPSVRPALPAALVVGWFSFLRAFLAAGGVEYGLRVAGRRLGTGDSVPTARHRRLGTG